MSAKKNKGRKKIASSKTKPRTARNMLAFVREQTLRLQSRDNVILNALRTLIDKAFERDGDLPTNTMIAAYLGITYDGVAKVMTRLAKKRVVINISRDPKKKIYIPNEPDYTGDTA